MVYSGLRLIMMGIFISELGSESNLKFAFDSDRLSGLILWEQDVRRVMMIAEMIIPFILNFVVIAGKSVRRKDPYRLPVLPAIKFFRPIKIVKERKNNS